MCIQPNLHVSAEALTGLEITSQSTVSLGRQLLHEAIRMRKSLNCVENPTNLTVITLFFFFGSYFCLDRHNLAWYYLREATTVAHLLGMHVRGVG